MSGERVLVTGASGFIGPHLIARLREAGYRIRVAQRSETPYPEDVEQIRIGDLAGTIDWRPALADIRHVVHLAGLAHAGPGLDEALYRRINADATLALAQAAREAGVSRFVYLSSIKAKTGAFDGRFDENGPDMPDDAYGRSKLAAERGLAALDLDWVALRPVLVYGPGVKANMAALTKLARLPVPLPFGGLNAPRSLLAVENLTEAIAFALTPACPARHCYTVSDPEPLSVAQMIAAMRDGLGRKAGLLPVPAGWLHLAARIAGREAAFARLAGGLVAPPEALLRAGWRPRVATSQALARLAASAGAG
ncbi:NAD-dependent epimerase/dehydratase family protein [Bosea sp. (in: a-proteobacteria)]|uniref:NAD-dependent epimerase/dehydratase family protein n=1 Tax=Bosea sp. (in: a-proteobacteria) TaxID=1871050 RepID=UPI003F6E5744